MYCRRCGALGVPAAAFCSRCGSSLDREPGTDSRAPTAAGATGSAAGSVETWMVPAILVTLLCCAPPGIVAIVYAARAQASQRVDDSGAAAVDALKARNWTIAGFLLGLVPVTIYAAFLLLGLVER